MSLIFSLLWVYGFFVLYSTFNNAQLGDAMIQQLENQGLQMAKERQDYFGKIQLCHVLMFCMQFSIMGSICLSLYAM